MNENETVNRQAMEGCVPVGYEVAQSATRLAGKRRILIVDDEVSAMKWLKINLEQTNHYVVETESVPGRALCAACKFQPDVILLDVVMPGMDGGELANEFRAEISLRHVPIIFLTAMATKKDVQRDKGLIGGLPFLAKPVSLQEVVTCLNQHLN
jgi:two-component system OmpR family response regulator